MYPKYVEINGKKYTINTDFRIALECNKVAEDTSIGDFERAMAIIYLLYGDEGLNDTEHHNELLTLGRKYLLCGEELKSDSKEKPDMDYEQDLPLIEASFMFDYHIDLENTEMHWWKFNTLINGLSNSDFGNCCILSNIRNIRKCDLSKIKDSKERENMRQAQEYWALKKYKKKPSEYQKKCADEFLKRLGYL